MQDTQKLKGGHVSYKKNPFIIHFKARVTTDIFD